MAGIGFKKSLFGFNKNDVLNYINDMVQQNTIKIKNLNQENNELSLRNNELTQKIEELECLLNSYKEKEDQIEKLANGIGALYVLAKNNAQSILENAKAGKEITVTEIQKNLSLLEQSQNNLQNIKTSVNNITDNFNSEVEQISLDLDSAKEQINQKIKTSDNSELFLNNPVFGPFVKPDKNE